MKFEKKIFYRLFRAAIVESGKANIIMAKLLNVRFNNKMFDFCLDNWEESKKMFINKPKIPFYISKS